MGAIFTNIAEILQSPAGRRSSSPRAAGSTPSCWQWPACCCIWPSSSSLSLLLVPIGFGMLMTNLPLDGIFHMDIFINSTNHIDWELLGSSGGMVDYIYLGVKLGIYPPLIFLGIGTMTDFEPLIARPSSLLLGASWASSSPLLAPKFWASPIRKPLLSASSAARTAPPPSMSPPSWPRICSAPSRSPRTATWRWCRLSSHLS